MFKKTVLVGILLVALLMWAEPVVATPVMFVDLVVPEFPIEGPQQGETYDVLVYITPTSSVAGEEQSIKNVALVIASSDTAVATLAPSTSSGEAPFNSKLFAYFPESPGWFWFSTSVTGLNPGNRYLMGKLVLNVKKAGPFTVNLDLTSPSSYISYGTNLKYSLRKPSTELKFCVPKTTAQCPELGDLTTACGKLTMDDTCGGTVVCAGQKNCAETEMCGPTNLCRPVIQLSSVEVTQQTLLRAIDAALMPKPAKKESDTGKSCTSDADCPSPQWAGCAEQYELCESTKLTKLSNVVKAIKAWWTAAPEQVCTPNAPIGCVGSTALTCNGEGTATVSTMCPASCTDGVCHD